MSVRRIVQVPEPVLRRKATKIHRVDESVQRLIDDLVDTLLDVGGAGLAAPQIGVPLRAFVTVVDDNLRVLINPEIIDESEDEVEGEEGCLSMMGWYGPVMRKERVTVRGLNRKGKSIKIKTEAWEARAFQHEIDHLNGILFTDKLTDSSRLHKVESLEEEEELEDAQVIA